MVFRDRAQWYWLLAAKPPMELVSINNPPITIVLMIRQLKYYSVTNRCFVWGVNKKKIYTLVWLLIVKIAEENWSSNFGSQGKHLGHKCLRLPRWWWRRWWPCKWPPLIPGPTAPPSLPPLPNSHTSDIGSRPMTNPPTLMTNPLLFLLHSYVLILTLTDLHSTYSYTHTQSWPTATYQAEKGKDKGIFKVARVPALSGLKYINSSKYGMGLPPKVLLKSPSPQTKQEDTASTSELKVQYIRLSKWMFWQSVCSS